MKKLLLIIAVAIGISVQAQCPITQAIDFTATDCHGEEIHLFDILDGGQYVLIDFFFTTCGPCQSVTPSIVEAYHALGCNDYEVFFMEISPTDDNSQCQTWCESFGVEYPTIGTSGGGGAICNNYQIPAYPTVILIAPDRSIVVNEIWPISNAQDVISTLAPFGIEEHECGNIAYRNVIIEEFTGRNCTYCPAGHGVANKIVHNNPGRAWVVNVHAGGFSPTSFPNLNTTVSTTIHNGFYINGYPTGVVNRSTYEGQSRGVWASLADEQLSQIAEVSVKGNALINKANRKAEITVNLNYHNSSSASTNYLTIMMLQDSIWGSQSGGSSNPEQWVNGQYCHMHILRDIITEPWGDEIYPTTAGTKLTKTYTYQIPEMIGNPNGVEVDLDNIYFLAMVSEQYQSQENSTRPILNVNKLVNKEYQQHWIPDHNAYADNMTLIGKVSLNGQIQDVTNLEVGAFCNNEVRGSNTIKYFPEIGEYLLFLTIYGNDNDNITFKLYDQQAREELDVITSPSVVFYADETMGEASDPYILYFSDDEEPIEPTYPSEVMWTSYDLQSNGFVSNRMYQRSDGTMGVVATMSHDYNTSVADRGTGYNHYDGSSWGASPEVRIEANATGSDLRTGWPSIAAYGARGEIVVNHSNGLNYYIREVAGQGEWEGPYSIPNPEGLEGQEYAFDLSWPRVVTSGTNNEIIHVVACAQYQTGTGEYVNASFYCRSTDGLTWDVQWSPLYNDEEHIGIYAADDYSISANGNTVAILYVREFHGHAVLYKSTDNGLSWKRNIVWENPYYGYDWETDSRSITTEPVYSPAHGSVAVGTDGVAHVALSTFTYEHKELGTSFSYYYGRTVDGIAYWNDTEDGPITSADGDPHNALRLWLPNPEDPENYVYHSNDSVRFCGWIPFYEDFAYFNNNMIYKGDDYLYAMYGTSSSYPSIAVDPEGNLAMAYSVPDMNRDNGSYYYRSVYVSYKPADKEGWYVAVENPLNDFIYEYSEMLSVSAVSTSAKVNDFWFSCFSDDTPGFYFGSNASQSNASYNSMHVFNYKGFDNGEEPIEPISLSFKQDGIITNPGHYEVKGDVDANWELTFELDVTNTGDRSGEITCEKIILSEDIGDNYFCWGSCLSPNVNSNTITLEPGETERFSSHFMPIDENWELKPGAELLVEYHFYEETSDEHYIYEVHYKYEVEEGEDYYWDPDETLYPNNMSITAVVEIDGEEQRTTDIEIGAFCGDEVRGSNRLKYEDGVLDRYFLYITIYGESGDDISFRIYDHATDSELDLRYNRIVTFIVNDNLGSIIEPEIFNFTSDVTHERTLTSNWNWYSTYVEVSGESGFEMITTNLGSMAEQLKSQAEFTNYYPSLGWYGALMTMDTKEMYMIDMAEPMVLEMTGMMVNPEEFPITLKTNWRWIPYVVDEAMSLSEAMSNITPHSGDYIKSQAGFSQYYEGLGWRGALETMLPGQGYMYQNTSGVEKTLYYPTPSGSRGELKQNITPENNYWRPDMTKYANNMNIIAFVDTDSYYEIGAFCEGECRGSARPIYIEELDKNMIFLTVYGEPQDEIMFRYYDVENSEEYAFPSEEIVVFGVNSTLGSIKEPYELHFGMLGVEEMNTQEFTVYPNPATVSEEIYLGGNFEIVEVYNALGVKIAIYENVDKIESLETTGIYVIKVVNGSESRYCRVIVR